jgi:hypothetical protein
MISAVADTHTALWHLFGDARLSAAAGAFISEAATARRKIAISTTSLAEVVYLIEKDRLPPSAYEELTQALADTDMILPKQSLLPQLFKRCGKCRALKSRTCQTGWWHQLLSILMCQSSAATGAFAPPA